MIGWVTFLGSLLLACGEIHKVWEARLKKKAPRSRAETVLVKKSQRTGTGFSGHGPPRKKNAPACGNTEKGIDKI